MSTRQRPDVKPPRFTDAEIEQLLADAFTAVCWPADRAPLGPKRQRYLVEAATEVTLRLGDAVTAGDVGRWELVTVLIGAALGALRIARGVAEAV